MSNARFADHPAVAHQRAVIANLKKNTGKTLDEWVRLVKKLGARTAKERVQWLRTEHRLGMTTANVIAGAVEGTRIDLGLALGKTKATGRVIDAGGLAKGDRITHRIPITSVAEIDAEVKRWMKTAYEMDKTEAKVHPLRTKT